LGIDAHRGELSNPDSLAAGARASDGVIHTAFNHDWSVSREVAAETDRQAIETMARAIAEAIGAGLGVPVRSLTADAAPAHFDWLAPFVAVDNPTSSAITRESLGWRPQEPGLLRDMRESGYFSDISHGAGAIR
jgi:hypothetical protein